MAKRDRFRLRFATPQLATPYSIRFSNGASASAAAIDERDQLSCALQRLGPPRPVLVLVGGADSLGPDVAQRIGPLFRDSLAPLLDRVGAAVIDGGTDSGVMALMGRTRAATGASFPLIGIAAQGTVLDSEEGGPPGYRHARLEPNHTHFVLVPGDRWGDESPWISAAAEILAAGAPSATLAAGGGKITKLDLELSLKAGRKTLLLRESGGVTDDLCRATHLDQLEALDIEPEQGAMLRTAGMSSAAEVLRELLSDEPSL